MIQLEIKSSKRCEMIDITREIGKRVPPEMSDGVCHLFCPHTTAGLTINENADPDVRGDMLMALEKLVPFSDPGYRHSEGNSAAHLKASLLGFSLVLPVKDGALDLGVWQGVYFCEFDGPRQRKISARFSSL